MTFHFLALIQMITGSLFPANLIFKKALHFAAKSKLSTLVEISHSQIPPRPTLSPSSCSFNLGSCIASLQACALQKNPSKGKEIHSWMILHGFLCSPASITSLINMYSKCHRLGDALAVFHWTQHPNLFAWNAIISALVANGFSKDAIGFYQRMRWEENIVPDKFTFPCVIKACVEVSDLREGEKTHAGALKLGYEMDVFVGSALINLYLKFSMTGEARRLFDELPERDVVLWNAMINGYAQIGELDDALEIFGRMVEGGIAPSKFTVTGLLAVYATMGDLSNGRKIHGFVEKMGYEVDVVVSNSLIDMYGKCKSIEDARQVFERISDWDIFSWNSILSVYQQSGDHNETLRLFDRMCRTRIRPDSITVTTALPACSHLAALMHGREIHGYMTVSGMEMDEKDVHVDNAIVDMYVKCGSLSDACAVFDRMKERDSASWNIMIMGYGMHGHGEEALAMFSRMCEAQVKPDEVTFVGVLSACSHAGLVGQGREILASMQQDHGVVPTLEHYSCAVDMLGRAGQLREAYELALSMPIEPNPVVWRAFLGACRIHGNAALAEVVAHRLFELDPGHSGSYVLLSNIYGAKGWYRDVSDVRKVMVQRNVRKMPGCSWIDLNTGVHAFVNGDWTHPDSEGIYAKLQALIGQLREYGYVPDASYILPDMI